MTEHEVSKGASHYRSWPRQALGSFRLRPLLLLALGLLAVFTLQRLVMTWMYRGDLADASAWDIARLMLVGLRYDLRAFGFAAVPLAAALALAPSATLARRSFRSAIISYTVLTLTVAATLAIIDALFFREYTSRLNWRTVDYIGHFGVIAGFLWNTYPVLWISLIVAAMLGGAFCIAWRTCRTCQPSRAPLHYRLAYAIVLATLLWLLARGWRTHHALDSSLAYFSTNNVVSQLSMNYGVSLANAVKDYLTEGEDDELPFPNVDINDAAAALQHIFDNPQTTFGGHGHNPFWRHVTTAKPAQNFNVVIILMESFAGRHVGALGNSPSQTPFFDSLTREGWHITQMFASGPRTSRGLAAVLCSFPDIGGKSLLKRSGAQGNFQSLPGILSQRGYETLFIYGGDYHFDNMKDFFISNGVDRCFGLRQMPAGTWRGHWGAPDHVVFDMAHQEFLRRQQTGRPFFATILTASNHQPHDIPPGCIDEEPGEDIAIKKLNSIRYADWAMRQFFEKARSADYYSNTVFVLVADHGHLFDHRLLVDVESFRVPCLFLAPEAANLPAGDFGVPCSQTDIGPTILGLLGGSFSHGLLGRDLTRVSAEDAGMAMLCADGRLALVRGRQVLVHPPDALPMLFERGENGTLEQVTTLDYPVDAIDMQRITLSLYHWASRLYRLQGYTSPVSGN